MKIFVFDMDMSRESKLAFCAKVYKVSLRACIVVGSLLVISGIILKFTFHPLLKQKIDKIFSFHGSSDNQDQFIAPPEDSFIQVYLFNVTNPNEINDGYDKPKLEEVGPFVFRETKRLILTEQDSMAGAIKVREIPTFYFERELSIGHPSEFMIYHINAPDVNNKNYYYEFKEPVMYTAGFEVGPFVVGHRASEILYDGYDVKLYKNIAGKMGKLIMMPKIGSTKYGLFYKKNRTLGNEFFVSSKTTKDAQHLAEKIDYCSIKARPCCTDTTICSSTIHETSKSIHLYNEELCQSRKFNYKDALSIESITVYRYSMAEIENPEENEDTKGITKVKCETKYRQSVSSPHFYGDTIIQSEVIGLSPNSQKHESHAYVEPVTGFVLRKNVKTQINIEAMKLKNLLFKDDKDRNLFPMLWINKETRADWQLMSEILTQVTYPWKYGMYGIYVVIGCGVSVILISANAIFLQKMRLKWKKKEEETLRHTF